MLISTDTAVCGPYIDVQIGVVQVEYQHQRYPVSRKMVCADSATTTENDKKDAILSGAHLYYIQQYIAVKQYDDAGKPGTPVQVCYQVRGMPKHYYYE